MHGGAGPESEKELADARGAVGFVGEVAVMNAGDGEHPDEIERDRGPDGKGAPTHPNHREAGEVQDDERHHPDQINPVGFVTHFFGAVRAVVGIDPLREGGGDSAEEARA